MTNTIKINAEYLVLVSEKEIYEPIKAMVYSFCKRFKTCESMEILTITNNGLTIPSQYYDDYINSVYCELLDLCIKYPNDRFQDTLFQATKKGLYKCYKSYHGRYSYIVKDKETGEEKRVFESVKCEDINTEVMENVLIDTYANTEQKAINNAMVSDILNKHAKSDRHRQFAIMYMQGYSFREIASEFNVSADCVEKAIKRMR